MKLDMQDINRETRLGLTSHQSSGSMGKSNQLGTMNQFLTVIKDKLSSDGGSMVSTRGNGFSKPSMSNNLCQEQEQRLTAYELFQNDVVLESQLVLAIITQILREDRSLYHRLLAIDWGNYTSSPTKESLLVELNSRLESILKIDYNLAQAYKDNLEEFVTAVNQGLLNKDTRGYNITLVMFFQLLKKDLITLDNQDTGFINGSKILFEPYTSSRESFSAICENLQSDRQKAFCIVQYFKDSMSKQLLTERAEVINLLGSSLDNIDNQFSLSKGYTNIYQLIFSYIN